MDSLTAGIALILVQFCIALVMAGVNFAAPEEKCTRYWAVSAGVLALGIIIVILNNRAAHIIPLLSGSGFIMAAAILQWHGTRAFYRKRVTNLGWSIWLLYMGSLTFLLFHGTSLQQRAILFSVTMIVVLTLNLHTVWRGMKGWPKSFVQALVPGAILLLIVNYVLRIGIASMQIGGTLPTLATRSQFEIIVAYLLPIAGILLFSIGLLLLYFERMVETNRHLATHDELSRLLNRRAIDAGGQRELEMAQRLDRDLTVAFIDIDMFKHFNDEFGHASGDIVIADVATMLQESCRNIDLVARYGGEEFLIVLPGVDRDDAALVGQRLVETMHRYRFLGMHPVTISVGLATMPHGESCSWDQLVRRADAALYEAKNMGRNRYCI